MLAPAVAAVPVEFSAGGSSTLAQVQSESGSWLSESWPGGSLPTPQVDGNVATYPDVYPGVDLRLAATATGLSEVLVVKNAQAAADPALAAVKIGISGATLTAAPGTGGSDAMAGSTAANASDGLVSPSPSWWDSSGYGSGPAGPGGNGVPMPVADTVSGSAYTVDVASVVNQPDVTYPAYVDPSFSQASRTFVDNAFPAQNYWNGSGASDSYQHVGYIDAGDSDDGRSHLTRSFWQFDLSGIAGTDITDAHLDTTEVWSYSCQARYVDLYQVGGISSSTTWNNQPQWQGWMGHANVAYGYSSSCPANTVGFSGNIASALQADANSGASTITFGMQAHDETDYFGWKKFKAAATLVVTLNHIPSVPASGSLGVTPCGFTCNDSYAYTNDSTPVLSARSTDADGDTLKYEFEVQQNQNGSWSTVVDHTGSLIWASGDTDQFTVGTSLTDGSYRYHVQAGDGTDWSGYSGWFGFTVDTVPPSAPTLSVSGSLSTSKSSFAGTVGVTTESITITPKASDNAYGYAYAIAPSLSSVVFPTNLTCGSTTNGYKTVCPSSVGDPVTVKVQAPDDTSVFAATIFDAAGNGSSSLKTACSDTAPFVGAVCFYAGGDYTSAHAGHSWLTETDQDTNPADCAPPPVPDSAVNGAQPADAQGITVFRGTACWTYDASAPATPDNGVTVGNTGNGVVKFTGDPSDGSRTDSQLLDTTKNMTVAAWVKPGSLGTATNQWFTMLSEDPGNADTNSGFYLQIAPDGNGNHHWRFCMHAQGASSGNQCVEATPTIGSGWTYVSGTYDAQDDMIMLHVFGGDSPGTPYVDSYNQPSSPTSAAGSFVVGRAFSNSAQTDEFIGEISDPVAVQGVLDSKQLQGIADLNAPANLVAPIAGS